jgi:DNA-binding LytR/AlgR family response regulator
MIRIALVEDEAEVRAQLQGYVQRHTRQYGTEFAVTEFADGMELLDDYRPVYDILFLDVEMKHLDGMETARRVRELDKDVIIVFITNMAQYAIGGYAVGALDYVLKPVPYFAFSQQLRKAEEQLCRRARHYLALPVEGGMRRLSLGEASVRRMSRCRAAGPGSKSMRSPAARRARPSRFQPEAKYWQMPCKLFSLKPLSTRRTV